MVRVQVTLHPTKLEYLKAQARAEGIPLTELIRRIIDKHLYGEDK
jgi:predicted DNA binding CopG/RHH family protein